MRRTACWLLEPDSSEERRLRATRYRFENVDEQRKAINDMSGTHIAGETEEQRQQILAGIVREEAALTERALSLGARSLTKPPSTFDLIKRREDANTFEQTAYLALWRTGLASVHGHYWADQMRDNPGQFDHEWFQPALQGAFMFVNEAMMLHHQRSTNA